MQVFRPTLTSEVAYDVAAAALQAALAVIDRMVHAPARPLHVDYGPHNVLVDGPKVSGIIDRGAFRIGDPAEDLSYMMQNFQGKFDRHKVLAWYREDSGEAISEYRLTLFRGVQ